MKSIRLRVNGQAVERDIPDNTLLIDLLRNGLDLTGTKEGCSVGVCGACTVLLDGQPVSSCLTLAVTADGCAVTTIEGLAEGDRLHPLQKALSTTAAFSAASVRRVRSCRPKPYWTKTRSRQKTRFKTG